MHHAWQALIVKRSFILNKRTTIRYLNVVSQQCHDRKQQTISAKLALTVKHKRVQHTHTETRFEKAETKCMHCRYVLYKAASTVLLAIFKSNMIYAQFQTLSYVAEEFFGNPQGGVTFYERGKLATFKKNDMTHSTQTCNNINRNMCMCRTCVIL